jgi:sugar/nucleoside kinase (ribokinase family)
LTAQPDDEETMLDVFVIGGVGIDTIVRVPELPLPPRETVRVEPVESYVGHTGHGVALGCHLLGLSTGLADVIGADAEGARIRRTYQELGLPLSAAVHPSGTRRSVNLVSPDGRRVSLYDGRHPAEMLVDPDLWRDSVVQARHVHVSIMDFARQALPDTTAAQCTVSTDLHDWDGENEYHRDFALAADLVFVSTSALTKPVDVLADRLFADGHASAVIAMAGSEGSHLMVRGEKPVQVPAVELPDRPVVDTNGAGDAYVSAFLATWLDGASWKDAAKAGSVAGAWACGSYGTHTDLIPAETLHTLTH